MSFHVLIPDNVDKKAVELLEQVEGITITAPGNMTREQTIAALPTADAMIIRSSTQADAELLSFADRLKVIARAGVGVDNVDLAAATAKGIIVMNTPDGNTVSTAEYTFGLMLALARHIPRAYDSMQAGQWDRKSFMGVELRGKTLGVVGFGRIGRAVARRALAFEMLVITYDPYIPQDMVEDFGARLVDLETIYRESDFITLHSIITDETRHMINAEALAKMKRGVRIVNAARGGLIDDDALAEAIRAGHVGGVAVDVYAVEPPPPTHPLVGLQNVLYTPHLAASTTDAQINVAIDAAQLVIDALTRNRYENVCNPGVLA
jgi:D-3-phosphoglycerate dehydrogenase / 2-oxoglutarate reductase